MTTANASSPIKTRRTIQSHQQTTHPQPTTQPMTFHLGEEAIGGVCFFSL